MTPAAVPHIAPAVGTYEPAVVDCTSKEEV